MGFISELKRRNVFRMTGIYLVAAWLIIQVANNILPVFGTSPWVLKTLIIALAIGLLPTVILSWVFELTPDGLKRDAEVDSTGVVAQQTILRLNRLLIGALLLALAYFVVDKFIISRTPETPAVAVATITQRPSIAVLPFDNRSSVAEDAFFVDGMHDDILTQLSKISGLKVISRTSVEPFRNTKLSMREIARQLGVKTILEGGVQRGGNRVRINMQLIDAETDDHLWAETYDRELNVENIFAIQSEVTAAITSSLQARLTKGEKADLSDRPTKSLAAWEAFQLGKQRRARRNSASLAEAEEYFSKAIALDPDFTLANVLLADTYISQIWYSGKDRIQQLDKASVIIERVRKSNPEMPEALSTAGTIAIYRNDTQTGEQLLRKALTLRPNYVPAMHVLADYLPKIGKSDEAIQMVHRAISIDPLSSVLYGKLSALEEDRGHFETAKTGYVKALEIDPEFASGLSGLAMLNAYAFRRLDLAVIQSQKTIGMDLGNPMYLDLLALVYQDMGMAEDSRKTAMQLYPKHGQAFACSLTIAELLAGNAEASERLAAKVPTLYCGKYWQLRNGKYQSLIDNARQEYPVLFDSNAIPDAYQTINAYPVLVSLNALGRHAEAKAIADRMLRSLKPAVRMGLYGYGLTDVALLAQSGRKQEALTTLELAIDAGWQGPYWLFMRDFEQALDPIRDEPRFHAAFARLQKAVDAQRGHLPTNP